MSSQNLVTINVTGKNATMKFNLDVQQMTVRSRVRLSLAEVNRDATQPVALVVVIDESGSTMDTENRLKDGSYIFPVEVAAVKQLAYNMGPKDKLAVVAFDSGYREIIGLTDCDDKGRDSIISALDSMQARQGSTVYEGGLQLAGRLLGGVTVMTRAVAFLTDGSRDSGTNPLPAAKQLIDSGIVLCTAAISDALSASDESDLKAMSGGANFKQCGNAEEVAKFMGGAFRKAQKAAVSKVTLEFKAIGIVTKIAAFDRVLRDGKRNYVVGTITQKSGESPANAVVEIGELGPGEQVDVYVEFTMPPVKAPAGKNFQTRTFGELTVSGISQGINTPVVIGHSDMFQNFATTTSGQVESQVEKLEAEWTAASALAQAAQTTDASRQQDILAKAADKVKRATAVFADDDSLGAALSDLETLQQESRQKGAAAAGKKANRRTAVFAEED